MASEATKKPASVGPVPEKLHCEACRQVFPTYQALRREVEDYVIWFCGTACYEKWRSDRAKCSNK